MTSKPTSGSKMMKYDLAGEAAIAATQSSQTWEGGRRNGLRTVAAVGIALERKALTPQVTESCQVPRAKTQELGVRTAAILAKTSLKGPHGVLERRWRSLVRQITLCLYAPRSKRCWNGWESVKITPPLARAKRRAPEVPSADIVRSITSTPLSQPQAKAKWRLNSERKTLRSESFAVLLSEVAPFISQPERLSPALFPSLARLEAKHVSRRQRGGKKGERVWVSGWVRERA
ncbi:MAG: hypothetical protein ACTS4U_00680 [Candidatus Hodgkinia cicadicola]